MKPAVSNVIILEQKPTDQEYIDIILGIVLDGSEKVTFVTWVLNKSNPENHYRALGHYFDNVRAALRDFDKRK